MESVKVTQVSGRPLAGFHFVRERLVLDFPGGQEALLECRCGRHHWLVVAHKGPGGLEMAVTCHGCGTRAAMPLVPSFGRGPGMEREL